VIVNKGKINFEKFPVHPLRFDILDLESKKKEKIFREGALRSAPSTFWGELKGIGAMTKKKAKRNGKKATKSAKKLTSKKKQTSKRPTDVAKVREDIKGLVKSEAKEITAAVVGKAKTGELSSAKYLFEMAGVHPVPAETEGSEEEDCLAKTLLKRMGIPTEPIQHDEDEPLKLGEAASVTDHQGEEANREREGKSASGNPGGEVEHNSGVKSEAESPKS
jgi:hypothetical protein